MSSILRPTTIDDEARIIELESRVFGVGPDAPFLNPALLRWKYWEPRADTADPRSLVIERDGRIAAHVGLWPVTICKGAKGERGVQMMDWVSAPEAPGAGVSLLQRLTKSYDFVYSIGGTAMTQSILPKFGFRTVATTAMFARPLRPFRQILRHQSRDAKLPIRLARNLWWAKVPAAAPASKWSVALAEGPATVNKERGEGFFEYLKKCPAVRFVGFDLMNEGRREGFLGLSFVNHQARLAGIWLDNPTQENWRAAFQLAQQEALRDTAGLELVARATTKEAKTAAAQAGLRFRREASVFLFRRGTGDGSLPLQFQMADDDAFFLTEGRSEFQT